MNVNVIKFKEAEEIMKSQEHSQFVKINKRKRIIFHPCFLGNTRKGIEETLKSERNLVSDEFGGAVIAYNNIKIQDSLGLIVDPYIHFDIVADFIVFKPTVGSTMTGMVDRVFKKHVSLLVYGIFNVSISKSESNEHLLTKGSEVEFTVERIYVNNRILFMRGALWSDVAADHGKKKTKKNQRKVFTDEEEESMETEQNSQKGATDDGVDEIGGDVEMAAEASPSVCKKSEKKKKKKSKKEKV
ncbi:DNA-directed RNA polymerase I subunit RPA43-like [Ostrea edulis]|uniref:DNA-directed RNA polymerase I subunit RPA43-like n=1 Tax=Ostrea edulis TaxID=37623 RepID=UPI0024AE8FF1|nr:DNA-directed RNA polymerase I subunit RPA43-like [Ostrea edulis]